MDLITLKNIVCVFFILLTVVLLFLPNHIIDTSSCKRNWVAVLIILSSASLVVNKYLLGISIILVLMIALFIHYLNVYIERRSHEC